jgi:hypothetical protein
MADAKLTALTAAGALAAADLFYVSQSAASRKATGTQLLALVGTAYVPLAGGTMTGALTIASGTLTASAPALSITQTWNANVAFTASKVNVTKTLSDGAGLLQDWQRNGTSMARIREDGVLYAEGFSAAYGGYFNNLILGGSGDVFLERDAAAQLALRNGTNQQSFSVYNRYTDPSNYERLKLTGVAGTSVNITAETLGTGGDNLDIVLTPAGTGSVKFPGTTVIAFNGEITCPTLYAQTSAGFGLSSFIGKSSYRIAWTDNFLVTGTVDTSFHRGAAGQVDVTNGTAGTWRDLKLRNLLNVEYHQMTEMTAPSAPAANSVRIYAEDNGSGKTRLMALFATGAAQQLAIEP